MLEVFSTPAILFFVLGAAAAFFRSNLAIPEAVAKGITLYLMAAIGLKGGVQVSGAGLSADMIAAVLVGIAMSFLVPLPVFFVLRRLGRLDPINAAAVAAHYGSVSVVTFVAGSEVLTAAGYPPDGYMVAVLALMETPAIIAGLMLAARYRGSDGSKSRDLVRSTLVNGSVVLLIGSFAIGFVTGERGFSTIAPLFDSAFRGVLCLFLLDMGLIAVRRLQESRALTFRLAVLAIVFPVINGSLGVLIGSLIGLDTGSSAVMGILAASASYIAVPSAMRLALPEANPGLYLTMSLGITFSFNIILGIPLYTFLALQVAAQ